MVYNTIEENVLILQIVYFHVLFNCSFNIAASCDCNSWKLRIISETSNSCARSSCLMITSAARSSGFFSLLEHQLIKKRQFTEHYRNCVTFKWRILTWDNMCNASLISNCVWCNDVWWLQVFNTNKTVLTGNPVFTRYTFKQFVFEFRIVVLMSDLEQNTI
jgi:hypothetical protein